MPETKPFPPALLREATRRRMTPRGMLLDALHRHDFLLDSGVANEMNIHRTTLWRWLRLVGIDSDEERAKFYVN